MDGDKVIIPFGLSLVIGIYTILSIMVTRTQHFNNRTDSAIGNITPVVLQPSSGFQYCFPDCLICSRSADTLYFSIYIIPPELRKYLKR